MTFSEKLEIAKTGSKAAYESLCSAFVDRLYTAALISLKDGQAAKNSVIIAIAEGYAGISRIKDEKHLCSWLVHELTKNVVDTLKEFRAQGVESGAGGIFAVTADMPDVERLIFAVSAVFGYGSREISVLTGMSENAVDSKLRSARAHLGRDYDAVAAAAAAYLAPESLKARYPEFDESKVIHKDENDEASAEASPAGAAEPAPAEEPAVSASADTAGDPAEAATAASAGIPAEPAAAAPREEAPPSADEIGSEAAPEFAETAAAVSADSPAEAADAAPPVAGIRDEEVFAEEGTEEDRIPENETAVDKMPEAGSGEESPLPLNAKTFIAVVSAEKMKGSEFLRLIGNTRISNNVYREIEQNPHLTKNRLIQLLEESPLTETDYYKLLAAVKHRREMLRAKEEMEAAHERAGLYSGTPRERGPRRRHREEQKSELQMALGIDVTGKPASTRASEEPKPEPVYPDAARREEKHTRPRTRKPEPPASLIWSMTSEQNKLDDNPFRPKGMVQLYDSEDGPEPIDPIAAIYARETGIPSMPERIEDRNWGRKEFEEREDEPVSKERTQEFGKALPETEQVSDTQQLEMPFPKLGDMHIQEQPFAVMDAGEPVPTVHEPEAPEKPGSVPEPGPERLKRDISVTQILEETSFDERKPHRDLSVTQILEDTTESARGTSAGLTVTQILDSLTEAVSDAEEKPEPAPEPPKPSAVQPGLREEEPQEEEPYSPVFEDAGDEPESESGNVPAEEPAPAVHLPVNGGTGPVYIPDLEDNYMDASDIDDDEYDGEEEKNEADDEDEDIAPDVKIGDISFANEDPEPPAPEPEAPAPEEAPEPVPPVQPEEMHDTVQFEVSEKRPKAELPPQPEEPVKRKPPLRLTVPAAPDEPEDDPDEPEQPRKRYKGNEHFIDDDEYVEGVNNGKMIFCAVCAVLLIGGACAMKFLPGQDKLAGTSVSVSSGEQTQDNGEALPAAVITTEPGEILSAFASYDEIASAGENVPAAAYDIQYLNASARPYSPTLAKRYFQTANIAYIYNEGSIRMVSLDPAAPVELGTVALKEREGSEFLGFTVFDGVIYAVTQTGAGTASAKVWADIFDGGFAAEPYSLDGTFAGLGLVAGKPVIVAHAAVNGTAVPHSSGAPAPSPSDIVRLSGSSYAGFTVIGEIGGAGLLDIYGGNASFANFDGGLTILAADDNRTYAADITAEFKAENARVFAGEAFSGDCLNGEAFIGADRNGGIIAAKGSNALTTGNEGEKPRALAWADAGTACVLSVLGDGSVMLYGFDVTGEQPASAAVTSSAVYSEKLAAAGASLAGLAARSGADGERSGLELTLYGYGGALTEKATALIGLDEKTDPRNLKYLTSDAESDPAFIAASENGDIIAVPTAYFDGFSEAVRIVTFSANGLKQTGELMLYETKSPYVCTAIRQGTLFVMIEGKVLTANAADCSGVQSIEAVTAALGESTGWLE